MEDIWREVGTFRRILEESPLFEGDFRGEPANSLESEVHRLCSSSPPHFLARFNDPFYSRIWSQRSSPRTPTTPHARMTWRNPAAFAISYIRELCRRYPWNTSFGGAVFFCEEKPPVVVPAACAVEAASSFFFFSSRVNSWSFCRGESALAAPFLTTIACGPLPPLLGQNATLLSPLRRCIGALTQILLSHGRPLPFFSRQKYDGLAFFAEEEHHYWHKSTPDIEK